MTNADIKLLNSYLHDDQVNTNDMNKIIKKLEVIVKQIEAQETYNSTMEELSKEIEKLK